CRGYGAYTPPSVDRDLQALGNPNERLRLAGVIHLGQSGALYAGEALMVSLHADPNPAVREAAARSLAKLGAPGCWAALALSAALDSDHNVRRVSRLAAEIIQPTEQVMLRAADWKVIPRLPDGTALGLPSAVPAASSPVAWPAQGAFV